MKTCRGIGRDAAVHGQALAILLLGAVIAVAACDPVPVSLPVATPEPISDGTPEVALLYISGEPVTAEDGLELRLTTDQGDPVRTIRIQPGERIIAQLGLGQGRHTLTEASGACALDVDLVAGREVDLVVTLLAGGSCALAVAGDHEPEAHGHLLFGGISVTFGGPAAQGDLRLRIRSLDTPSNPVPDAVEDEPDRPGHFAVFELPQGVYEVRVLGDGVVLGGAEVIVGTGGASWPSITIVPSSPDPAGG